jgi:MFS family permease
VIARRAAWYALGVLALANLVNYGLRNSFQPLYDDLRARFGFSDGALGFIGFAYMFAHATATLPMGWAGDRFDRRRLIALGLGIAAIASAASAASHGLVAMSLARAGCGLGTAVIVPVANSILGEAFDGPRKAVSLAVFNLGLLIGGAAGIGVGTAAGFPATWYGFAASAAVLVGLVATLPVPPRRVGADPAAGGVRALVTDARALLAIRPLRWLLASATAMAFATGGYLGWMLKFLHDEKGMTPDAAQLVLIIAMLGGLAGVITGGRVGDLLRRRWRAGRLVAICVGLGTAVPCALVCIYAPVGPILYVATLFTMFFVSWYHGPIAASVDDLAPAGRAATAQALVIFSMHAIGTGPAWLLIGVISGATSLTTAMVANTAMVVVAVLLMIRAARVYGSAPGAAL